MRLFLGTRQWQPSPCKAARLEKVTERLMADAPNLERAGADLIAWYLSPDRHPAGMSWSAKHADTQRRLCERFVAPVIAAITCQDSGLLLTLAQCDRYSISSPRTVPPNCADFNASRGNGHVPRSRRECEHLPRQAGRVPPICGSGRSGAVAGRAT